VKTFLVAFSAAYLITVGTVIATLASALLTPTSSNDLMSMADLGIKDASGKVGGRSRPPNSINPQSQKRRSHDIEYLPDDSPRPR
jgi:hypothetical protein